MTPWSSEEDAVEAQEDADEEETYLDRARHDHGVSLWALASVFEKLSPGDDTRYRDFHVSINNNWKVVAFDISKWDGVEMHLDQDLFAVRR